MPRKPDKPVPGTCPAVYPDTVAYRVFSLSRGHDRPERRRIVGLAQDVASIETRLRVFEDTRNRFLARYVCAVCREMPQGDYMATNVAWAAAGFQPRQFACFPCFIQRLGRPITVDDFPDVPANAVVRTLLQGHA
jgi:hypothetical protein